MIGKSMNNQAGGGVVLLVVLAFGLGVAAHHGMFYPTGRIYYESCFKKKKLILDSVKNPQISISEDEPQTSDPHEAALWATCESIAQRAMEQTGMETTRTDSGGPKFKDCPNLYTEVPAIGLYYLVIDKTTEFD